MVRQGSGLKLDDIAWQARWPDFLRASFPKFANIKAESTNLSSSLLSHSRCFERS
jgi:hypothetical protein